MVKGINGNVSILHNAVFLKQETVGIEYRTDQQFFRHVKDLALTQFRDGSNLGWKLNVEKLKI